MTEADQLVTAVMAQRGYPTEGFEERLSVLSVDHSRTLDHYRRAHEISGRAVRRQASTEELRQAMVHYRALFEDLLAVPDTRDAAVPAQRVNDDTPVRPAGDREDRTAPAVREARGDVEADGSVRREQYAGGRPADRDPRGR
ncbi:hypothetical protein [Thermocatellispora tengchongensis]|uniref:hypothetical protein n=1 Tax=Thermocatellispora tengchongensis TaxID=1073253 RepID=UPI00362C8D70